MPIQDKNGNNITAVNVIKDGVTTAITTVNVVKAGVTTTVFSSAAPPPPQPNFVVTPPPPPQPNFVVTPPPPPPPTTVTATYFYQGAVYDTKLVAVGTAPGDPAIGNPEESGEFVPSVNNPITVNTDYLWLSG
jgi:hypothetical protein